MASTKLILKPYRVIDIEKRLVTLKGPAGNKEGDKVEVIYREALAIYLEPT